MQLVPEARPLVTEVREERLHQLALALAQGQGQGQGPGQGQGLKDGQVGVEG